MKENNEKINSAIMAMIEWGKTYLISPHLVDYLKEIKKNFYDLSSVKNILNEVLSYAKNEVEKAKTTLKDKELITASPHDEIAEQAEDALNTFDVVVFLNIAIQHLIKPSEEKEKALESLDGIMSGVSSFIYDEDWSPLRLTVINHHRRKLLDIIPEDEIYQFPWYELYSQYDDDTISALMFNYPMLSNKKYWNKLSEELKGRVPEIVYELNRDKELHKEIKDRYAIISGLSKAAASNKPLLLWHLAEKESEKYPVDNAVANAGIVRVSTALLINVFNSVRTETDNIYWAFLTAFCAPEISNNKRIELLNHVEKGISEINIDVENKELLSHLKSWFNNKYADNTLAKESYEKWNTMLSNTVSSFEKQEFEEDADNVNLLGMIDRIIYKQIEIPEEELEKLFLYIPMYIQEQQRQRQIQYAAGIAFALYFGQIIANQVQRRGEIDAGDGNLFEADKPIEILCSANDNNEYPLLPYTNLVSGENSEKYSNLYNFINTRQANTVFCGGWIYKDNECKKLEEIHELGSNTVYIGSFNKNDGYKKALLCLSADKKSIEEIIELGIKSPEEFMKKAKEKEIVLLIITFI